jgi:hypothetical protein
MAALLGGLRLALGTGPGSELRRPLGIAIVGGLLLSQFLTLYTTPVIYIYLARFANFIRRAKKPARDEVERIDKEATVRQLHAVDLGLDFYESGKTPEARSSTQFGKGQRGVAAR